MNGSQPRLPLRMFSFEPDYGAHRAALLDGDLFDRAFEIFLAHLRVVGGGAAILAQQHQLAGAQRFAAAARNRIDDVRAARREAADERTGVDFDAVSLSFTVTSPRTSRRRVAQPLRRVRRRFRPWARAHGQSTSTNHRASTRAASSAAAAVCCPAPRNAKFLVFTLFAARPRRAPGDALRNGGGLAVEPAHPGAGARIGHRNGGTGALRGLGGDRSQRCGSGDAGRNELPSRNALLHRHPPVASCSREFVVPD